MIRQVTDPEVQPGWWAFHCCHMDLEQLDADTIAALRTSTEAEWASTFSCYPTRNEALSAIAEMWDASGYPTDATHVREMIQ